MIHSKPLILFVGLSSSPTEWHATPLTLGVLAQAMTTMLVWCACVTDTIRLGESTYSICRGKAEMGHAVLSVLNSLPFKNPNPNLVACIESLVEDD